MTPAGGAGRGLRVSGALAAVAAIVAVAAAWRSPWPLALVPLPGVGFVRPWFLHLGRQDRWFTVVKLLGSALLAVGVALVFFPFVNDLTLAVAARWCATALSLGAALSVGLRTAGSSARATWPLALLAVVAASFDPTAALGSAFVLLATAVVIGLLADHPRPHAAAAIGTLALAATAALGLAWFLPRAQPLVEARVAQWMDPGRTLVGFGGDSTLGEIAALGQDESVALRLYGPRAAKLRGVVLTRFDGRRWSAPTERRLPQQRGAAGAPGALGLPGPFHMRAAPAAEPAHSEHFGVLPEIEERVQFVPSGVWAWRGLGNRVGLTEGGTLDGASEPASAYELKVGSRSTSTSLEEQCSTCLEPPAKLDPRVRALALDLARRAGPATDARIQRTFEWLALNLEYTLEPGRFTSTEPLAEFLFEKRRGYCEYFASSAAVLLRLQGVPTRYVKGFNVTEDQRVAGHYLVRMSHAHAWIEVFEPLRGWIELDPTPAAAFAREHGGATRGLAALLERGRAAWSLLRARGLDGRSLTLIAVLVLFGWLVARRRPPRRRASRRGPAQGPAFDPGLVALVKRFDEQCARSGLPRARTVSLREHWRTLPLEWSAAWRGPAERSVKVVYDVAYAGRSVDPAELRELERALVSAGRSLPRAPRTGR